MIETVSHNADIRNDCMARPRKDADTRRTQIIAFRVSVPDRLRLEYAAVAEDLKPSEYARRRTLSGKLVVIPSDALPPPVFDELRRIAVNLAQLTRTAGQTRPVTAALGSLSALVEHILLCEIGRKPARAPRKRGDADALHVATVRFRVTAAEHSHITGKAAAAEMTPSEYARRQALYGQVAVVAQGRVFDPEVLEQLQSAGVAINRDARIANQTGRVPSDLHHLCTTIERLILASRIGQAPASRPEDPSAEVSAKPQAHAPARGGPS